MSSLSIEGKVLQNVTGPAEPTITFAAPVDMNQGELAPVTKAAKTIPNPALTQILGCPECPLAQKYSDPRLLVGNPLYNPLVSSLSISVMCTYRIQQRALDRTSLPCSA